MDGYWLRFSAEPRLPAVYAAANGRYTHAPKWYRNFVYEAEVARGLDFEEDLAAPGFFTFDLDRGPASLVLTTDPDALGSAEERPLDVADRLRSTERVRRARVSDRIAAIGPSTTRSTRRCGMSSPYEKRWSKAGIPLRCRPSS